MSIKRKNGTICAMVVSVGFFEQFQETAEIMKQLRAAIVGTGGIAKAHIEALRHEQARVELVAAVDVAPERLNAFCDTYAIPHRYTDVRQMLDEQRPNLVHICTPPSTHFEL